MGNRCPLMGHTLHLLHSMPLAFAAQGQDSKMAECERGDPVDHEHVQVKWGLTMVGCWLEVYHVVSDLSPHVV